MGGAWRGRRGARSACAHEGRRGHPRLCAAVKTAIMAAMMFVAAGPPALVPASTSASARAFRVCADPNDLPYSDTAHQGYENRIAALLARDLEVPLEFVWFPQVTGFARKTVN